MKKTLIKRIWATPVELWAKEEPAAFEALLSTKKLKFVFQRLYSATFSVNRLTEAQRLLSVRCLEQLLQWLSHHFRYDGWRVQLF